MRKLIISLMLALGLTGLTQAQEVIVYSPFNDEFIQALARPFTAETGIRVLNIVISTGESQSRLRAEAARPQADFWLSVRPAILEQAFDEGLIQAYKPAAADSIAPAYHYDAEYITATGTYPLVFFYNTQALKRAGLEAPAADWDSLLDPSYRGQIVMPHPATSGTAYSILATLLQRAVQGGGTEADGWEFIGAMAQNVAQFTRSGRAPQTLVSQGEYPIGVVFYVAVWQLQQEGFPVEVVLPDPAFAEPYGAAIVKGAPNPEHAEAFFDYLLTPGAQAILTQFGNYPVVAGVAPPEGAVEVPSEQVISIDYRWSADSRDEILETFQEVAQAEPQ
jgi:iron(III) transport system substrate-binding protein